MNIIYDKSSIDALKPYLDKVATYPNPATGADGPIKWGSVLEAITILSENSSNPPEILDIGSGNSALPIMLSTLGVVQCVDSRDVHKELKTTQKEIKWAISDAFDYISSLRDDSLDYAVDSCAVIHFETTSLLAPNDGLLKISQLLLKKLRVGGKFIIVTDCIPEIGGLSGEFINYNMIIDCVRGPDTTSGFKLVGDSPSTPIDTFLQKYSQNGRSYDLGIVRLVFEKV